MAQGKVSRRKEREPEREPQRDIQVVISDERPYFTLTALLPLTLPARHPHPPRHLLESYLAHS